jgi:hypothetical protein
MLRNLATHQYAGKGHAWPQLDINWPYRVETSPFAGLQFVAPLSLSLDVEIILVCARA